jgi:hypothetical protein
LPSGLNINSSTAAITGTPTASGTASFTVKVADSSSTPQSKTQALTITINSPLTITTTSLPDGTAGTAYSATVGVSGGTSPYTFSISSGALPAWASLNASTGAITGSTPATGSSTFTVQVKDSSNPAQTTTQSLTIAINPGLEFTTVSLASGAVGVRYSQTLSASGGTKPYAWSISSGSVPSCLALGPSSGTISGTATAGCAGTANFTVTVTDSSSPALTANQAFSIDIVNGASPLTITTTALENAPVGLAYNTNLLATGGTSPYTWSIISGSLPSCLSFTPGTGEISGTPVAGCVGQYSFTVEVTDSTLPTPQTQIQNLSLLVESTSLGCGSGNEGILTGQYAFELRGFNGHGSFLTYVGSLTLDGAGNIVGGEADSNAPGATPQTYSVSGTYTVGPDNRGCATISLNTGAVTLTTRILLGGISGGLATTGSIIEFDPASNSAYIASGPLLQQTTTTTPSAGNFAALNGTYVHVLSGWDSSNSGGRVVCAGIHTNVGTAISNTQKDCNDNDGGSANVTSTSVAGSAGTATAPDQYGRFEQTLGSGATTEQSVAYINSAETQVLSMTTKVANANAIVLAGEATEQSNVAFNSGSLSGNLVFYAASGNGLVGGSELGLFSSNGTLVAGTLYLDEVGTWQTPSPVSCGYTVAANGRMTVGNTGTNCSTPPIFYLTAPNAGVLISTDAGAGAGQMLPQTVPGGGFTAATLTGTYAGGTFEVTGQGETVGNELAMPGGTGTNITGMFVIDSTNIGGPVADELESITATSIATDGTISVTGNVVGLAIDSTHLIYVNNSGNSEIIVFGP